MLQYTAGLVITINRSEYPDNAPEDVLKWHADEGAWWSSSRHDGSLFSGQDAFVRFAGTNEVIGQARVIDPEPTHDPIEHDPTLQWRYEFEYVDRKPIREVYLRDFGVRGGRARRGLIGLRASEQEDIAAALEERR